MKKIISFILPIFNEEKNIPVMYHELATIIKSLQHKFEFEIIMVNDGSRDTSWQKIVELAAHDRTIKAINFSRNFGYQSALTAGYDTACGDAVITMDSDMQHPPSLVCDMIKQWEQGYQIVYARRIDRKDSFLKKITARLYHNLLDAIAEVKIPRNISDFRLIDKQVLAHIKLCREKSRYLRGMIAWSGFNHTFVDFHQPERIEGTTKYSWARLFKIAFDGVTGFSLFPLKIAAYVGAFVVLTGLGMLGIITIDALFFQGNYPLFKWLVTIIYVFIGVLFLLLWLIGEYIGRIYEELKGRPLYIIAERYNNDQKICMCKHDIPIKPSTGLHYDHNGM